MTSRVMVIKLFIKLITVWSIFLVAIFLYLNKYQVVFDLIAFITLGYYAPRVGEFFSNLHDSFNNADDK
jgi:hypothetical protein